MLQTKDFRLPATCLLAPLPEHEVAAELLSDTVDAIIAAELDRAGDLVRRADMPVLHEYSALVMGGRHPDMRRSQPVSRPLPKADKVTSRMPTGKAIELLYARDGWRCRYCDCRVISPTARSAMIAALPGAIHWSTLQGYHGAFYALTASPDHVVPHSAGGTNDAENLVTACWPCQFGKGNIKLEEFGMVDPRLRPPIVDEWDGLTRLLNKSKRRTATGNINSMSPVISRPLGSSPATWFESIDATRPTASGRLIDFIDGCADLDVTWSLGKVLIVKMSVGGETLHLLGVQADGLCEIPWHIDGAKKVYKVFAGTLAAGIPGAIFYETPRTWTVAMPGKKRIDVLDLLEAAPALRNALERLRTKILEMQETINLDVL